MEEDETSLHFLHWYNAVKIVSLWDAFLATWRFSPLWSSNSFTVCKNL